MVVGDRAYVNAGGGWRRYAATEAERHGQVGATPRARRVAGQTVGVREMASPEHIVQLLRNSRQLTPKSKNSVITYRGSTTAEAMGYSGDAKVTYTLRLGADYLPRQLVERYHTAGGSLPFIQFTTVYSDWGSGRPIKAPA